jgi:hypothetical protein
MRIHGILQEPVSRAIEVSPRTGSNGALFPQLPIIWHEPPMRQGSRHTTP